MFRRIVYYYKNNLIRNGMFLLVLILLYSATLMLVAVSENIDLLLKESMGNEVSYIYIYPKDIEQSQIVNESEEICKMSELRCTYILETPLIVENLKVSENLVKENSSQNVTYKAVSSIEDYFEAKSLSNKYFRSTSNYEFSKSNNEVILSEDIMTANNLKIGDTLTLGITNDENHVGFEGVRNQKIDKEFPTIDYEIIGIFETEILDTKFLDESNSKYENVRHEYINHSNTVYLSHSATAQYNKTLYQEIKDTSRVSSFDENYIDMNFIGSGDTLYMVKGNEDIENVKLMIEEILPKQQYDISTSQDMLLTNYKRIVILLDNQLIINIIIICGSLLLAVLYYAFILKLRIYDFCITLSLGLSKREIIRQLYVENLIIILLMIFTSSVITAINIELIMNFLVSPIYDSSANTVIFSGDILDSTIKFSKFFIKESFIYGLILYIGCSLVIYITFKRINNSKLIKYLSAQT